MKLSIKLGIIIILLAIDCKCFRSNESFTNVIKEIYPNTNTIYDDFPYLRKVIDSKFLPSLYISMPFAEFNKNKDFRFKQEQNSVSIQIYSKFNSEYFYGPSGFNDSSTVKMERISIIFENEHLQAISLGLCMHNGWNIPENNPAVVRNLGKPKIEGIESQFGSPFYIWSNKHEILVLKADYTGSGRFSIHLINRTFFNSRLANDINNIYNYY